MATGSKAGKAPATDEKGPDNNKRLAALESGVAAVAVALAANGISLEPGEDPLQLAVVAIKSKATDLETIEQQAEQIREGGEVSKGLHERINTCNARCGKLEEGVSDIVVALAPLVGQSVGEDPLATAVEQLESKARLEAEYSKLAAYLLANPHEGEGSAIDVAISALEAAKAGPDNASAGELAAIARAEAAETELGSVKLELAGLQEDLDAAISAKNELAQVVADKGYKRPEPGEVSGEDGDYEPAPDPRARPESARDFGPDRHSIGDDLLAELLAGEGGRFEVAFSNGEYELVELAPVAITAADLALNGGRRCVLSPLTVRGGTHREEIHGAALLLDGEQIRYCTFPAPLVIEPGQERGFTRALYFG